jgi:hypothetical protein
MATTIMISTNVKPALRGVLVFFIFLFLSVCCGVNNTTGGLQVVRFCSQDCPLQPQLT